MSAGVCAVLSKIKKIFTVFCCSFHSVRKCMLLYFSFAFIYRLSYKRGKKVESKLWVQFWVESKLLLSSWLFFFNQLTSCLFLNAGSFPTWLEVKEVFCPMGPERLVWNRPVICLSHILWNTGSFMATLSWLCCLSEEVFLNGSILTSPKGYSSVACNVWGE